MLESLKEQVCAANLELVRRGLVLSTWGNASAIDRERNLVVIKPSGVPYESMRPEHMVVVDLEGKPVEGELRPSSDTLTHVILYNAFSGIRAVVHTHSHYATCWAQARRPIACFGTTHADYFHGAVLVTDELTPTEIENDYERNTGLAITRCFARRDPMSCPVVLVASHAPFAWGATLDEAVENAVVLEEIAKMALHTLSIGPLTPAIDQPLLDKHFLRKHGAMAYYGQQNR